MRKTSVVVQHPLQRFPARGSRKPAWARGMVLYWIVDILLFEGCTRKERKERKKEKKRGRIPFAPPKEREARSFQDF